MGVVCEKKVPKKRGGTPLGAKFILRSEASRRRGVSPNRGGNTKIDSQTAARRTPFRSSAPKSHEKGRKGGFLLEDKRGEKISERMAPKKAG